ncbi:hypothetical protein QTP86_027175 [Hemibagrus guttatus]|nr:hypothetical protein QTP86_027175 [Hemibagrus guttatus]
MVFESLVSDVLNRFLGDYVENLDKSQLKIGIWGDPSEWTGYCCSGVAVYVSVTLGGIHETINCQLSRHKAFGNLIHKTRSVVPETLSDVVLENLRVKENTLSELDVPFKVKAGQIGKLTLKIPWKNLYSEAVVATLDGLYLLVVPEASIRYDAAKEARHLQEAKQRELQRIEEALQLVALREKPPDEKKDTFAEKLFTQIIKNLQVKISSIHIRYEDDVSDPQKPLSVGVTLSELSLQTTDENWRTCILNEAAKIIYKLGRLECLCVYWNVNSPIFYRDSWEVIVDKLKAGISNKDEELKGYEYIFKPIFASAKICINANADVELKSPKAKVQLEVQNIAIEISKPQYLSVLELLESVDCMVKNAPYRKFRPDVPVNKHARQWWQYGINSVLEVHIRRFNQMWSWTHIRGHRQRLKAYKMAYKTKLTHSKLKEDTEKQILELEKVLDVFNITLARQQAQMEVVRSGQQLTAKKAKQNHGGGGLFSGFFGRKERKKKDQEEEDKELESIDAVMTTEEKTKLYTAIGYSENSPNLALPKNYVAMIINFKLLQTSVTVREEASVPEILKVQMIGLSTTISQRPGAQAIKVEASLEHWYVTGLQQQGVTPSLIASVGNSNSSLLSVLFELNPEDTAVDQLLRVHSQPVEIIYDALTINSLVEFFKTAKGVDLEVITSATLSKLEEIKEKTASGLAHIIETRKVLDLKVDLKPSYLLLPKSGFYHSQSDLIIVDFGNLQLNSIYQSSADQATASFSSLEEIMDRAYERFSLELRSVQVLYCKSGDTWKSARMQGSSQQHILQRMDFTLELAKCMVEKDIRMPRFKVVGELPLLHVKISDLTMQGVVELVDSIPFPHVSATPPSTPTQKAMSISLADTRPKVLSVDPAALQYSMVSDSEEDIAEKYLNEDAQRLALEELTDVHFTFEIKTVLLELLCQDAQEGTVLALNVSQLGCEGKMRTYDLTVKSYLHKISLDYCGMRDAQNQPLHLVTSSDKNGSDLLKIEYIKADVNGPSFQSVFDNTEQVLKVEFSSLEFLLHTRALLSTINYLNRAVPSFTSSKERDIKRPVDRVTAEKTVSTGSKDSGVVSFKLFAMLGSFGVNICDDRSSIADIQIQGIDASLVIRAKETEVFARLRNVAVIDVDTKTIHKKVVSIVGEEVFSFKLSLYPGATEGVGYSDTSKVDGKVTLRLGCIQIIYLHKFLVSLLTFVDNFQAAKKAISIATAQAAEKAAASVKDFALKSFRLSMDIKMKAPLIIIPQSSMSHNAFVVDLGLITMSNTFSLTPAEGFPLPAVVETMDVKLTHLKLSRTVLRHEAPQPHLEILQPVNLELLVKRNLAASWFTKIPGVEVKGLLKTVNITIGCEDLCVLMKILAENTEEGHRTTFTDAKRPSVEGKPETNEELPVKTFLVETESQPAITGGSFGENVVIVLLKFEIMEVLLTLNKPKNGVESPFLVFHAAELGIDTKVHKFDMMATTYIKTISVKCPDIPDFHGEPIYILSSSAKQGAELLKVEYFKADRDGPKFFTLFENTEQKMNVIFSSLDLTLHTEALLSIMDFMSTVLSCSSLSSPEKEIKINEETKTTPVKSTGSRGQKSKQGCPDFPIPRHFLQLFRRDPEAFPGQPRDIVSPACPGSSPGSLPGGACPEHLPRETFWRHSKQMPEPPQLSSFDVEEQRLYSELLPGDRAPYPISKGAPRHPMEEARFGRLYPGSYPFGHDPELMTIGAQSRGTVPDHHAMLQRHVSQDSPTTSRDLRYWCLATKELLNYLSDLSLGDELGILGLWFLYRRRCPPLCLGIATATGTRDLTATAPDGYINNGGGKHGPLRLHVPNLPRNLVETLLEVGVEDPPNRGISKTFPIDPHNTFGSAILLPRSHYIADIVDLKILVQLGAFNMLLCDQHCNIADMKIHDLHGSLLMKESETHVSARLRDFVVINVDPKAVHNKASQLSVVCIVDDEVFSFNLSLTPKATEGDGYTDTTKVDGKVKLNVGCIQVVYLQKFVMTLVKFSNSFQLAKEALSVATAQAAEKAVSSVRDFAQKSFRIALDIRLKAPLIIIPQSSVSHNAVEVDLGLITVRNSFSLLPVENLPLPAIIDNIDLELTQLKLSRLFMEEGANKPSSALLQPVNLVLSVRRNLAATWYHKMAALEVDGDLKPMEVALNQDDLVLLLKILMENIGEASSIEPDVSPIKQTNVPTRSGTQNVSENLTGRQPESKSPENDLVATVKFSFNVESLGLVLYNSDSTQPGVHQESLCIGEFMLRKIAASGKLFNDSSLEVSSILTTCTLDDRRSSVQRITPRMVGKRDDSSDAMIDLTFNQNKDECSMVAVIQKLYLCASMEFLTSVADFFIQALAKSQTTVSDKPRSLPLKQISEQKGHGELNAASAQKKKLRAVVIDPEVVFVANLMKADAPALVASFQCDFSLFSDEADQVMKVNLKDFKILACPFIRNKDSKAITTVLRPCSVVLDTRISAGGSVTGSVTVDEVIIKISPIILNTVLTITAAMTPKPKEEVSQKPVDLTTLWAVRDIYSCNYWFLDVETATEVTERFQEVHSSSTAETFSADVKVVQVTLESGQGHHTVPLLLAESSLSGCALNWSSLLSVSADMTLEVNYFNESHAVWEPLIERVDNGRRRWKLGIEVKNNPVWDKSPVPGDDFIMLPESRTSVNICSKDTMNITLSKCCLNVFQNLTQAFSEGTVSTLDHSLKEKAPFTIQNFLGIPLVVQHGGNLRLTESPTQSKMHEVGVGGSLDLEYCLFKHSTRVKLSTLQRQESCLFSLSIVPTGYSEIVNIPVDRPGRRLYNIRKLHESVSVLLQISASEGNKVITVRAPLQIINHFSVPFAILKYSPELGGLVNVGVAEPEKEFHVTLDSYRCQLFLMPVGPLEGQYCESTTYITWKEQVHVSSEVRSMLQCPAKDSSVRPVFINTLAVPDNLCHINSQSEDEWDPAYIIHLHPAVCLRNLLPYSINYLMEGSAEFGELLEGGTADLLNASIMGEIMELALLKYQGRNWSSHVKIIPDMPELFPVCFTSDTSERLTVDVYAHTSRVAGRLIVSIFSPYWIINKTARVLQYRAEDIYVKHPADFRDVILFSFKKKNIFSKNKLQLCVSTSSWSDSFSLDTVGSYGCVRCQDKSMDFLVEISIQLSSFNLTRIVTISPFYTLANKSSFELEVGEVQNGSNVSNKWHYISSTECLPLWPDSSTEKLCVRVVGSEFASKAFFFNIQDNGTLLCMEQYGGIIVDVNISDHSTVISFTDFYDGAAPAMLVNHTPRATIAIRQSGCEASCELKPGEVQLFVWDNPAGVRKLCWACQGHSGELDLIKDQCGQFAYDGLTQVHWVSFLDGRQRILLFTDDVAVVTKACQAEELEQFQQEVNISIQNLGLSLINNDNRHEIAYMGITSSGVVWEMKPKNRWKAFNNKNISLLEKAYQNHLNGKAEPGCVKLETGLEVDFTRVPMVMRHPYSCLIRRNFLAGFHVELKQSQHQRSLRAQLHWLQVDNQLTGAIFPIVFHPVPPPKSIVLDSEPKPFIDVSIITRFNEHSQVMQFKYFMVLVQEMAVKMDQGFLGEILAFFAPTTDIQAGKKKSNLIEKDLNSLQTQLMESSIADASGLSFFEHFHISPIKLHLSLSIGSSGDQSEEGNMLALQSVNLLLKSIGATLTDVDDIIFKLAFFEIKYQFYRRENLMWAVIKHYTEQFLKQMYVLVLGLDVLGNPFGLIRGLSEGMEAFFYEPIQGAVQGPEEFAEGFVIGVRSFLGHTVGGAAGMVSRITGSVGKGLAAISMDKEYQQKRREEMNRPSKDFGASLAKGGMGLLKGVVGGVTGIVTKPVEGVKKEGAAGFFKGIGKGLVGVVTRPTGGIVDMASSAFQGIQRAAESTEEVTKLRPVRLIKEDGIIRPYDQHESEGYDLFQRSEITQLDGEVFREHYEYPGHRKTNIIVTNRRVLCVKEIDLIGHFNKEWECQFEHFLQPAHVEGGDVVIYYKEQNKLKILKDGQAPVRVLHFPKADMAEKLRSAIQDAQVARKQYQMVRKKSQRFISEGKTS